MSRIAWRIAVTVAAAGILLSPAAARASWRAAADSLYAEAEERYLSGEYRDAASLYSETVDLLERHGAGGEGAYFAGLLSASRFLEGACHEKLEHWDDAIDAYSRAVSELAPVADVVRLRMARCRRGSGEYDEAISLLMKVSQDPAAGTLLPGVSFEIGQTYFKAAQWDLALQWLRVFLAESSGYEERALARLRMAEVEERRGDENSAAAEYAGVVNEHPRSPHAHEALRRGRRISRGFTDRYHQGLVLYNRGRFRDATEFFEHYLRHDGEGEFRAEATYFLGRSHQRRDRFESAAREYRRAIDFGPETEYYDLAWLKLGYCLSRAEDADEAISAYDEYLARHPDREAAADVLWEKARLLEEERRWDEAGAVFLEIDRACPASARADEALFRAGLCLYKRGAYVEAESAFAGLFLDGVGESAARALFWAAKCRQAVGHREEAVERYRDALEAARDTYYGRRALAALSALRGGASDVEHSSTSGDGNAPLPRGGEASAFAVWLAEWHQGLYLPAGRLDLRRSLARDPAFVRADILLRLHEDDLAAKELTILERRIGADPRMLDILCDYYARSDLHRRAIRMAERILRGSPASGLSETPLYLRKKICPTHFAGLVVKESRRRGVNPYLVLSLVRQESLFEPRAVSWVGARGLSQIMPRTGRWIAMKLDRRGFRTSHLLEPETNIEFGVYYLARQIEEFDGDVLRALAAYNGGPENVDRWWDYGGGADQDVFVEDIGYSETNDYVRRVYLYWKLYEEIYGR